MYSRHGDLCILHTTTRVDNVPGSPVAHEHYLLDRQRPLITPFYSPRIRHRLWIRVWRQRVREARAGGRDPYAKVESRTEFGADIGLYCRYSKCAGLGLFIRDTDQTAVSCTDNTTPGFLADRTSAFRAVSNT